MKKLYTEKDEVLFNSRQTQYSQKYAEAEEKIALQKDRILEKNKEIIRLKNEVSTKEYAMLPIQLMSPDDSLIFRREPGGISETAAKRELDFLICGNIQDVEDYQVIEAVLWNNLTRKKKKLYGEPRLNQEASANW